jgi:hypothetical protein
LAGFGAGVRRLKADEACRGGLPRFASVVLLACEGCSWAAEWFGCLFSFVAVVPPIPLRWWRSFFCVEDFRGASMDCACCFHGCGVDPVLFVF